MYEHIRVSDADRDRIVERLREHYADGRLTSDELDERVSAALSAKTYGDLRAIMTDLPEPELVGPPGAMGAMGAMRSAGPAGPTGSLGPQDGWGPPWAAPGRPMATFRRGPRILPLVLIGLVFALAVPGGAFVFLAFLKLALAFGLVMCVMGVFAGARFRRHVRRYGQSATRRHEHHDEWRR
jgi:hypothetical protein